ncbi:MAG TPA: apolipoprotein N-acyltransferase [Candidatus Limnocylindrales bacterium]|nr:apolipoprotein N-acyltransferase [Candidatus Limnocylindrales bacterium]
MRPSLRLQKIALAAASGALLTLAFPRVWLGWVAWFALVPLLIGLRRQSVRAAAGFGWVAGFVFYLATLYWIPDTISNFTTITPALATVIWFLLAAVAAYSFTFFAAGLEWLAAARISRLLAAPVVWVVVEWMRTFFIAGFPWNSLGYSQIDYLPIVQIAEWTSVYGISAGIVLTNVALAELWVRVQRRRSRQLLATFTAAAPAWALILVAVSVPSLLFAYGSLRIRMLDAQPYEGALRVGVVQGNVAQSQKWDVQYQDQILQRYLDLSEQAADQGARLLVWPEAALPFYFSLDERTSRLAEFTRRRGVDMLVGAPGLALGDDDQPTPYNQAWLVRADGSVQGPYDKIQLVPFGEYIPLHGLFGWVDIAVQAVGEFGRGTEHTVFESAPITALPSVDGAENASLRPARFGTLICYEGIFPALTRRFAVEGIDFLVNISNDAWYGDTAAPDQHLAMAALRSVENRMPMVRSTNTGISAFITAQGHVGPVTPLFEPDVAVETVLMRRSWSFYREYGDVFLYACMAVLALLAAMRVRAGARVRA